MEEIDLIKNTKLSLQRALLGAIYPAIRGIAFQTRGIETLTIICYLDRSPVEEDYENLRAISSEVGADIGFKELKEICIYSRELASKLNSYKGWVYLRKEV